MNGKVARSQPNRLDPADRSVHDWYRFVLSFPPHLVRDYLERFGLSREQTVLDPFSGTGTTLVECKKQGISSVGIERNPMAHFASAVKVKWNVNPAGLLDYALRVHKASEDRLRKDGLSNLDPPRCSGGPARDAPLRTLPPDGGRLLLKRSISPVPLHKALVVLETLEELKNEAFDAHARLALAKTIVYGISNLSFGPEVGVGRFREDADVPGIWLENMLSMAEDLKEAASYGSTASAHVHLADARCPDLLLAPESVDAVITSPPYPNEKDYTRTTRLESVILGFIKDKADLRSIKEQLVRSNTRSVYKTDADDRMVEDHEEIGRIADRIEQRRRELRKTSGFERLYARVTRLYFGGMTRHLSGLRRVLRPGARLAYVVGDQASYLRVMIRTGELLASIAEGLGYEVVGIDLFRTRLATATKELLREEVLLLRWRGKY